MYRAIEQALAPLPVWGDSAAAPEDCIVPHRLCLALVPEATTCLVPNSIVCTAMNFRTHNGTRAACHAPSHSRGALAGMPSAEQQVIYAARIK